jgi:uncharacterized SAM-binding protein YcdF (DUF218 family)
MARTVVTPARSINRSRGRRLRRIVGAAVLACAAVVTAVAGYIATYESALQSPYPLDAVIVLGAAAYAGTPSPVFAGRLDFALDLLRAHRARFAIVTGGGRDDPSQPEARAGATYLRRHGIDAARVLTEMRSTTTLENLCFAKALGAERGLVRYAIISDPLHVPRAMRLAQDIGLSAVPAATPHTRYRGLGARSVFLLRETYLYGKRLLLGSQPC